MKRVIGIINSHINRSKHLFLVSAVILFLFAGAHDVLCQRSWTLNTSLGDAWCLNMPLVIYQEGFEKIKFTADYKTESFKLPVYYSWKIGTSKEQRGWELELIHLKIFLTNNPPEVQYFAISHGFNYLIINRIWDLDYMILRFGTGIIISHPESTIRNLIYDNNQGIIKKGYQISGPGLQIAIEKRFPIIKGFFFSLEAKAASAIARVRIAEGHAVVPQVGFHGLFGFGYSFLTLSQ